MMYEVECTLIIIIIIFDGNAFIIINNPPILLNICLQAVIFRVMRLFKPAFSAPQPSPVIVGSAPSSPIPTCGNFSDTVMSPYILLPESFGDTYLGETFSAYVATINAIQDPIYNISLTLRLTTQNSNRDLEDCRQNPNIKAPIALASNEGIDAVFHHKLTEVITTFMFKNILPAIFNVSYVSIHFSISTLSYYTCLYFEIYQLFINA